MINATKQYYLFCLISLGLLPPLSGNAASQIDHPTPPGTAITTSSSVVAGLAAEFGPRLLASRYMEKNGKPVIWPGYEGLPTLLCEYKVTDHKTGTTKSAPIVLLDPTPEMLATWIVDACQQASGTLVLDDARSLFKHIISQSGGQFPVAGVVYEDMEGDGFMKAYCFRDGVTVRVDGVEHRTTAPLTADQREASLRGNVNRVYTYARVASTSPNDYKAAGGTEDVGDNQERKPTWLSVVRNAYISAWKTGRNDLIVDWAKSHR